MRIVLACACSVPAAWMSRSLQPSFSSASPSLTVEPAPMVRPDAPAGVALPTPIRRTSVPARANSRQPMRTLITKCHRSTNQNDKRPMIDQKPPRTARTYATRALLLELAPPKLKFTSHAWAGVPALVLADQWLSACVGPNAGLMHGPLPPPQTPCVKSTIVCNSANVGTRQSL